MQEYVIHRPDPAAMETLLADNRSNAAGIILRLAWLAGLLRDEIQHLTWAQIDFTEGVILLPDRAAPMQGELPRRLEALRESRNRCSEFVVLSDRDRKPLTPQSISRLARTALDRADQREVRLIDLRHDYILRLLETHSWQYVSRAAGIEAAALNLHFGAYLDAKKVSTRAQRTDGAQIDEFALWKLLQTEKNTPAGLALWLTWQLGLKLEEIVDLRWGQVDLAQSLLRLPARTVPLSGSIEGVLRALAPGQAPETPVVCPPRSTQPYDRTRLSRLARAALVRGGLDNVTLRDLRLDGSIRVGGENQVTAYLRKNPSITRNEAARLLGLSPATAYARLKQMVKRGRLTQVGARYYLKDAVVPPEQQRQTILDYLAREGFAYRQDIARLLGIEATQCRPILQRLIAEGSITQENQRYVLGSRQ